MSAMRPKDGRSRPRKFTPDGKLKVIGALASGADLVLAARAVRATRNGLEKAWEKDPDFKAACVEARDLADETIVKRLYDEARNGNITAMIFWLKNRRPLEWRDRRDLTVGVYETDRNEFVAAFSDGTPIQATAAKGLPN